METEPGPERFPEPEFSQRAAPPPPMQAHAFVLGLGVGVALAVLAVWATSECRNQRRFWDFARPSWEYHGDPPEDGSSVHQ